MLALTLKVKAAAAVIVATATVATTPMARTAPAASSTRPPGFEHQVHGTVLAVSGNTLVLRLRDGRQISIDGKLAYFNLDLYSKRPVIVWGSKDAAGGFHAHAIWRSDNDRSRWTQDY